jgi:hypothetical protein
MDKDAYFNKGLLKQLNNGPIMGSHPGPIPVGLVPNTANPTKLTLNNNRTSHNNGIPIPIVIRPVTIQNNYIIADDQRSEARVITEEDKLTNVKITFQDYKSLKVNEYHYDRRSFSVYFKDEILTHHRLLSVVFNTSLMDPLYIRLHRIIFEFSLTFALSAILFSDSYIDSRASNSSNVNN